MGPRALRNPRLTMAMAEPIDIAPTRMNKGAGAIPAAINTPPNTGPTIEPIVRYRAGGVLVLDTNREILGAVGVSGDLPDNDESCAIQGVELAGLLAGAGEIH